MSQSNHKIYLRPEWDQTFQLMDWWDAQKVKDAHIMVVGAGALGNEVLKNLALMNVGHILIVDFDTIEYSNLSRSVLFRASDCTGNQYKAEVAAKRIQEINPNIKVQTIVGDISMDVGLGVFKRMDVVIGCLDNRLARLFINRLSHRVNRAWIDGGIERLKGRMGVYAPGFSCYECELSEVAWQSIRRRLGCPDIAKRDASLGRIPTTPISSSIIAAMQVQEAIKLIHEQIDTEDTTDTSSNKKFKKYSMLAAKKHRFYYDGMGNEANYVKAENPRRKSDCISHGTLDDAEIIKASELSAESTIAEALQWVANHFEVEFPIIELEYEVILEITTSIQNKKYELVMPKPLFTDKEARKYQKVEGEKIWFTKHTGQLDFNFPKLNLSLRKVGIPELHILNVRPTEESDYHFVELTGDEKFLKFKPA